MSPPDDAVAGVLSVAESFVRPQAGSGDPLWYKDALIYQLHVKAFFDANNDGIGDFEGLTRRLDYLQDLGVTALWLLPFYPSPLRDDGYDIAEYKDINPAYGRMADFKAFVREAHRRKLRVITELVVNHTSDQHRWFQRARTSPPGSPYRDFYVWSDTDQKFVGTRIIFVDTEKSNWTWDPVAQAYYWHRFYAHQPDLNFDNPRVFRAIVNVMKFWLDLGVDGLRLDAVPYLIEREGTINENLPETHEVLKRLRAEMDSRYGDRMLLAEANQWPEDVLQYFGDGDECHMAFHFPLMPRIYMAVATEDRHPITDIMRQTPEIPDTCQWAIFLRNHDELTLEMVTDRERDYLWNYYAADRRARLNLGIRRRLAPLMENDRRKIELLKGLLLSMPGTPVLYYGDEIGMGDNVFLGDRDGVRTPMHWSFDRNGGFSRADPASLYLPPIMDPVYGFEAVNVEAQTRSPGSLLNWTKRLIAARRTRQSFGRGTLRFLYPSNRKVIAYLREYEGEVILVVANLARTAQAVELDLSDFRGRRVIEVLGRSVFPPIGELPYLLTLQGHSFYWFELAATAESEGGGGRPAGICHARAAVRLGRPVYAAQPAAARTRRHARFSAASALVRGKGSEDPRRARAGPWRIAGGGGRGRRDPASRLPDAGDRGFAVGRRATELCPAAGRVLVALGFRSAQFATAGDPRRTAPVAPRGRAGRRRLAGGLRAGAAGRDRSAGRYRRRNRGRRQRRDPVPADAAIRGGGNARAAGRAAARGRAVQYLGAVRRIRGAEGLSPAAAGGAPGDRDGPVPGGARRLREHAAADRYDRDVDASGGRERGSGFDGRDRRVVRVRPQSGRRLDAGAQLSLPLSRRRAERGGSRSGAARPGPRTARPGSFLSRTGAAARIAHRRDASGARRIRRRRPGFCAGTDHRGRYRRVAAGIAGNGRGHVGPAWRKPRRMPEPVREIADQVLDRRDALEAAIRALAPDKISAVKCRHHGDYHLGQVLAVQNDFYIIDFEGEPSRPVAQRRRKNSPLRDVAGMIRSFDYAASAAVRHIAETRPAALPRAAELADSWRQVAVDGFRAAYRKATRGSPVFPANKLQGKALVDFFTLEKAVYEVNYELANRPDWVSIPLAGILRVLAKAGGRS